MPVAASYLWKATYSATVDEIRRVRRRRESALDELPGSDLHAPEHSNPDRRAASRETGAAIRECLGGLIRDRRLAVTLHL